MDGPARGQGGRAASRQPLGHWSFSLAGPDRCSRTVPLAHASTTVTFSFETWDGRLDTWAACVVNNLRPSTQEPELMRADPVACIGSGEVYGLPAAVPIPNDDPRFTGALFTWLQTSDRPFCGSCV
ncbi:hypothetical protein [Phytohabitans aurantiacus]|uniref:Uncharacterized protein n=1 Tax=Phytohabitans aurantiacus TaxID=3016789 RepID=A0ABQ5R0A8_9ACTN|nr:hypothetical protein [Phytohabitans aurantiacus]GLH99980.1 hypothetical protein Pa4123_52560 [Phytohabitans aurantiacus]